jgi:hypothetical protein
VAVCLTILVGSGRERGDGGVGGEVGGASWILSPHNRFPFLFRLGSEQRYAYRCHVTYLDVLFQLLCPSVMVR